MPASFTCYVFTGYVIIQKQLTVTPQKRNRKKNYMVQSTIFIKYENKRGENVLETCKQTFSKAKFSTQHFQ